MLWLPARFITYAALLITHFSEGSEERWRKECPTACSCHLSHLKDLPMRGWLTEESTGHESQLHQKYEYNNEAIYPEDETPNYTNDAHELMKMAICIFQKGNNAEDILGSLPSDLEVLTILQSPDSGHINLGASAFQNLLDLVALEIQGFFKNGSEQVSGHHSNRVLAHFLLTDDDEPSEDPQNEEKITLLNDALQPLSSLQYLNLQYVKLQGSGRKHHEGSRPFPIKRASYRYSLGDDGLSIGLNNHEELISHNLVFLEPDPDGEILPYQDYHKQLEHSGISMFHNLPNLIFLRIYGCGLKELNWEMFDGLTKLQYLSLENNDLRFIPEFTFYGAPTLKVLSLAFNKLLSLQSTSLAGLLELKKLDLSHNNFSHLSELSLPPFPHLKIADFRHNPIETVFSSTFEIMNATETLYLGGDATQIEVRPKSFSGLELLQKLSIHNVKIQNIERSILIGMPNLKELELQGFIESIEYDAFLEVPMLEKLTLQNCHLKTISMDALYGLYNLFYLDLSNNLLETLPPGLFDLQPLLKELLLQNNKFKELPEDIFKLVPAKMIRLEGNPWYCTCSMMNWRETSINKVKQKTTSTCHFEHDKGSSCSKMVYRYVYDKRVAPKCETPEKYKNWNVFYVMRKILRCKKAIWNGSEFKRSKALHQGEEYFKKKNEMDVSEKLLKNNNSTLFTINNATSTSNIYINDTDKDTLSNSTYLQTKNASELKDDTANNSKSEILDKTASNNSQKLHEIEERLSNTTSMDKTTSESDEYKRYSIISEKPLDLIDFTTVKINDNFNSIPSNNTQQIIPKTKKLKEKTEPIKKNKVENQELNELSSLILSEAEDNLNNNKLKTSKDNNNIIVIQNSDSLRNINIDKSSHQPPKVSNPGYIIFDGTKNIKVSKKAFKLEMEKQRKEKLRIQ